MAIRQIEPDAEMRVDHLPILIYGPPGCGKTSLAQTCDDPVTLDFDGGIHRSSFRKTAFRFDTWADCVEAFDRGMFDPYKTLVIDTGGRALDSMIPALLQESAKNGNSNGLSIQGWGALGSRFSNWMRTVRSLGKEVVMLCHEEIRDNGGASLAYPDLPGKMSYKEIHKSFDVIARIRYDGRRRVLDASPSESQAGKNAACWDLLTLPDLANRPRFLAELIAEAKDRIGKTSEASRKIQALVEDWIDWLSNQPVLAEFNAKLPVLAELPDSAKKQVWALVQRHAKNRDWVFQSGSKQFQETAA
jgi:nucleoside-triphosphatase THEP1